MSQPVMEKMVAVVDALQTNPDVELLGGIEHNYLRTGEIPRPNGFWSRTLAIYVYPTDPIYDADELNEFMHGLTPDIEPTMSDAFRRFDRRSDLELGKLYFDETIGTVSTIAVTTSVELNPGLSVVEADILEGSWTIHDEPKVVDLKQRTWVKVYPDGGHATDAAEGRNEYRIPPKEIGKSGAARPVPHLLESETTGKAIETTAVEA